MAMIIMVCTIRCGAGNSTSNLTISKISDSNMLQCESTGSIQPISWYYNDQPITAAETDNKYTITTEQFTILNKSGRRSNLFMENITVFDEGVYSCKQGSNKMAQSMLNCCVLCSRLTLVLPGLGRSSMFWFCRYLCVHFMVLFYFHLKGTVENINSVKF